MSGTSNFDELLDQLAERVAQKLADRLGQLGSPPAASMRRLLTVEEAATYLGRTEDATRHLIASGQLQTVRSDKRIFLDIEDLNGWILRHKKSTESN